MFGIIDKSHISIISPRIDPKSYYCSKGYYTTLIQRLVDAKCMFWDFDYGWAGSIYDWILFQSTEVGKKVMKEKFCHTSL
jgi:hypothetical protein